MWIINNYKKAKKAKVRSYVRGYNILRKRDNLSYISNIKEKLSKITENGENFDILNSSPEDICLQQFLVQRLLGLDFNKQLLSAIANESKIFVYPLPLEWRKIIQKEGLDSVSVKNSILWNLFKIKWYLIGLATGLIEIFNFFSIKKERNGEYAYFVNLSRNNIEFNQKFKSLNVLQWFSKQDELNDLKIFAHSVKNINPIKFFYKQFVYKRVIPKIKNPLSIIKFVIWFIINIFFNAFSTHKSLIFRELIFSKIFRLAPVNTIAKKYLFHNSVHIFRPLWTYEVEKKGAEIILYFYSTNIISLKIKNENHIQDSIWHIANWPKYWGWNKSQKSFIKQSVVSSCDFNIKGIIPFSTPLKFESLNINSKKLRLLVFDVQPTKNYIYNSLGLSVEYYTEDNCIDFLNKINLLAIEFNLDVYIKRKRASNNISKKYINKLRFLLSTPIWNEIPPDYDPDLACELVKPFTSISMPFTSTGMIASYKKVPSVYFDNLESLDETFHVIDSVQLISDFKKLKKWMINCLRNQQNNKKHFD
jgi:polysaccharide biosynthesis PFTS motif protein